jgi:hypothetical protein
MRQPVIGDPWVQDLACDIGDLHDPNKGRYTLTSQIVLWIKIVESRLQNECSIFESAKLDVSALHCQKPMSLLQISQLLSGGRGFAFMRLSGM